MGFKEIEFEHIDPDKVLSMSKNLDTIFQYNSDINKTSYLNWRTGFTHNSRQQFVIIGEAYFSTAYNLLQQCLLNNSDKKADSWIFPIMFNIVHGTEVYLKAINAILSIVLNKTRGVSEGGHDLKALCGTARNLIIQYKNQNKNKTTSEMYEAIKLVENFILNIYAKTDDMTFARYPLAKNKEGHFYIESFDNEVIDLELLKEQMIYLFRMLEFIYEMPEMDLELRTELMADMMEYY